MEMSVAVTKDRICQSLSTLAVVILGVRYLATSSETITTSDIAIVGIASVLLGLIVGSIIRSPQQFLTAVVERIAYVIMVFTRAATSVLLAATRGCVKYILPQLIALVYWLIERDLIPDVGCIGRVDDFAVHGTLTSMSILLGFAAIKRGVRSVVPVKKPITDFP